ncbi:TIGR04053 family radical SAM/SPASM domain-containing protein [Actinomyces sp.]|uniref:TIGR04053 family radical SAM/SPASM domain-containing protein n=1 Tax=Actinomyces sp. TaxID=29317 RepID=UPI00289EE1F5|nr:TIGR04053 family radical SAM/SPASM domain-containing protein [Actinomyces sp.]
MHGPTTPDIPAAIGSVRPHDFAWDRAPMMLYWELTLACGLVCRHCRAKAMKRALPGELSTEQAVAFLDDITGFGDPLPHVVLTGGDPLQREDLYDIMAAAGERGIGVSVSPSVTPLLTRESMRAMHEAGSHAISLSLDGSTAALHDGIRRVAGTFDQTMAAFDWAEEVGMPVQVNTLVTADTAADLPAVYRLLTSKKVARWTLFFLIQTGRGVMLREVTPDQSERIMVWLHGLRDSAPFQLSTTEAIHYRRVLAQDMESHGMSAAEIGHSRAARAFGVRDGNGIVFVSHVGDVTPSGFMPLTVGNIKEQSIVDLYRDHPLMRELRDPAGFHGKCGACEYNRWCGGARSRAWAATGDPLAEDPMCTYVPAGWSTRADALVG